MTSTGANIVMAGRVGLISFETMGLVGSFRPEVVRFYQKWPKEGQLMIRRQTVVDQGLYIAHVVR